MSLRFFNTLTRKKENFVPINEKKVSIYTCGPTVYNYIHIGNLRTFLFEDILVRYLGYKGYEVHQIMNLTDVDDKTIRNSIQEKVSLNDYTQKFKDAFFEDIQTLNITPAEQYPCATDHIDEMIGIIQRLEEKGMAYRSEGSIYFSINKFNEYGKLAHLDRENLEAGASGRVSNDEYEKENIGDFVLWKAHTKEDGDVYWDTSLGRGRPGWHIECSAMSMKYLGESFDIHTGGVDNIFPHHENEIAQSEGVTGKPFVRYWLHSEFLNISGEKSSKSKGNVIYLQNLIDKGFSREVIRFSLIQNHYRSKVNYSEDILRQAKATLEGMNHFIQRCQQVDREESLGEPVKTIIDNGLKRFEEAMDDDLNMSAALAAIFETIREVNKDFDRIGRDDVEIIISFLRRTDQILGVLDFEEIFLEEEIEKLIDERNQARKDKDYHKSDQIRDQLKNKGIILEDTPQGIVWKRTNG